MPAGQKKRRTVVVMAHQGAGDLLMMVPMLKALNKSLNSNDSVYVVVKSSFEKEIVQALNWEPDISIIVVGDGGGGRALRMLWFVVTMLSRKTDYFIAPLLYDRIFNAFCVVLLRPTTSVGRPGKYLGRVFTLLIPWRTDLLQHQVEFYNKCLVATGLAQEVNETVILDSFASGGSFRPAGLDESFRTSPLVGFGPGATPRDWQKTWPTRYFGALAKLICEKHPSARILLFGGNADAKHFAEIIETSGLPVSRFSRMQGGSFADVIRAMQGCVCVVAGTTGLGHMAAAANVPIIVPCLPTNPAESGPYTGKAWVVTAELVCAPCYRDAFGMCKTFECMSLVEVDAVYKAFHKIVNGEVPSAAIKKQTTRAIGFKKFA